MRIVLALLMVFLVAPLAAAQSLAPTAQEPAPVPAVVVPAVKAHAAEAASIVEIPAEARAAAEAQAVDPMPSRGSFWWIVAVIVVAGVILAVLL